MSSHISHNELQPVCWHDRMGRSTRCRPGSEISDIVYLHPLAGPPGTQLAAFLGDGLETLAAQRGAMEPSGRVIAEVTGPDSLISGAASDLPAGPARAEAIALRLFERGFELRWADPVVVPNLRSLLRLCRARGRASVKLLRADPSLARRMQIGSWFETRWRTRLLRRVVCTVRGRALRFLAARSQRWLVVATDLAFWVGVHEESTAREWRLVSRSSYVALLYHRFASELKPGQDRINVSPARFKRHLLALRIAAFRPLTAEHTLAFHTGAVEQLPSRSFSITVDDALADCVIPLMRSANWHPQLFVCTRELGGSAYWIDGEPVATWDDIDGLATAGVAIGSHGRHHVRLTRVGAGDRTAELAGSLSDLRQRIARSIPVFAFPNGDHDPAVCAAARLAGYRAAYTTQKGRNGWGTDPYRLRRVSVHAHDGALAVLWKLTTGEALPRPWLRARTLRLWTLDRSPALQGAHLPGRVIGRTRSD
jgi:peptidoglycan/xylan/chitin deacetylase (PgdA/CDA1 family)